MSEPPPEEPYHLPGTVPAWPGGELPGWPMTAKDAEPFVPKIIA